MIKKSQPIEFNMDRGIPSHVATSGTSTPATVGTTARPFGPRHYFNDSALRASPTRAIAPAPNITRPSTAPQRLHDHCSRCLSTVPGWSSRFQSNSTVAAPNRKYFSGEVPNVADVFPRSLSTIRGLPNRQKHQAPLRNTTSSLVPPRWIFAQIV